MFKIINHYNNPLSTPKTVARTIDVEAIRRAIESDIRLSSPGLAELLNVLIVILNNQIYA